MKTTIPRQELTPEFKYIIVRRKDWTQRELDDLNVEYQGVAKWIFGTERNS